MPLLTAWLVGDGSSKLQGYACRLHPERQASISNCGGSSCEGGQIPGLMKNRDK
jgi:hypothetical protein